MFTVAVDGASKSHRNSHMRFDEQRVVRPVNPEYHARPEVIRNHKLIAISIADESPVRAASRFICCARGFPTPGKVHWPGCCNPVWRRFATLGARAVLTCQRVDDGADQAR